MAKILLLEDQSFSAGIIQMMLTEAGHSVTWLKDGVEGLASFAADRPDLVITDLVMPEMDGVEVIRAIRGRTRGFPIIAISGGGKTETYEFLETARTAGATEAIRKPVSREQLLAAVDRCLELRDPEED